MRLSFSFRTLISLDLTFLNTLRSESIVACFWPLYHILIPEDFICINRADQAWLLLWRWTHALRWKSPSLDSLAKFLILVEGRQAFLTVHLLSLSETCLLLVVFLLRHRSN